MKIQMSLFGLLMACVQVQGRQWQELIDHEIAQKANVDSSRYELKIEADPFAGKSGQKSASTIPTVPPPTDIQNNKAWTSLNSIKPQRNSAPSTPNVVPSFGSVSKQTPITEDESTTKGCENGVKYEVHMMDTWGDGWDQTAITITGIDTAASMETTHTNSQGDEVVSISKTIQLNAANKKAPVGQIFQGSLQQGFHDSAEICLLPNQCYQLVASGGEFSDEVSWELRPASVNPDIETEAMLSGGASTGCTFSLPNENGHYVCPKTCSNGILASASANIPPAVVEETQAEQGQAVEEKVVVAPRQNPVTDLIAGAASTGSGESASAIWSKFKNTAV